MDVGEGGELFEGGSIEGRGDCACVGEGGVLFEGEGEEVVD